MKIEIDNRLICHDCGAKEGEYHKFGCDMERCPFCGGQLIGCGCMYKMLEIKKDTHTTSHEKQFLGLCEEKERIPWVMIPVLCELCGELFPEMFNVEDKEWEKYVVPELQDKVLCHSCYDRQKKIFSNGWRHAKRK